MKSFYVWLLMLLVMPQAVPAALIQLLPGSTQVSHVVIRSDDCLPSGNLWRAVQTGGRLELYAPTNPSRCAREFVITLADACVESAECDRPVSDVQLRLLDPDQCPVAFPLPVCARQAAPIPSLTEPFVNFRSSPRIQRWTRGIIFPPGGDRVLVLQNHGSELRLESFDRGRVDGLRVERNIGHTEGALSWVTGETVPITLYYRVNSLALSEISPFGRELYNQSSIDNTVYSSEGRASPLQSEGDFIVLDGQLPGQRLTVGACEALGGISQKRCELILDGRRAGRIECGDFLSGSRCVLQVSAQGRDVHMEFPNRHIGYDAWFGPVRLLQDRACCTYVADAMVHRLE